MSSPHGVQAATFDLDGLMFNTEALYEEVGSEMLERRGKTITRALLDQMMGRPSRVALEIMIDWHQLDATVDELQEETDQTFGRLLPARLAVMPGLLELLDALEDSTIPKAFATSSRRAFVDQVLGLAGLSDRFEFILTAEDVVDGKPHPEIYLTAARRFQLQPHQVLVLEDSENGCRAAVAAGTFTVAVPAHHSRRHDFSGAAFVADGLGDRRIYRALGLV